MGLKRSVLRHGRLDTGGDAMTTLPCLELLRTRVELRDCQRGVLCSGSARLG